MAFWRRTAPATPDLDHMDALALAGPFLEIDAGMVASGIGSICYRGTDEPAFRAVEKDARDLLTQLGLSPRAAEVRVDEHGFKWLVVSRGPALYPSLVTDLRAASRVFVDNGFGAQLLCAMTVFEGLARTQAALVYLYKRGTVYPFAPRAEKTRNNRLELAIKNAIEGFVPVESDLEQWFALWDAPGMRH
jgi:hypothetical protein